MYCMPLTFHMRLLYLPLDRDEIQTLQVHSLKERNEVLHNIVDCLVREYEDASVSDSVLSYPLRHMLIPHMESLLKVINYSLVCLE